MDLPELDYQRVLGEVKKGQIRPVYLLHGEEEYLVREALDALIAAIIPEADRELSLFALAGGPDETERLATTLVVPPLLSGRKLIVVRDTHLFHSRQTIAHLVQSIRDHLDKNPQKAAAAFLTFLGMAGWKLEDLQDGGWKSIKNEDWRTMVEGDGKDDREAWLPRVIDLCGDIQGGTKAAGQDENRFENLLRHRMPPENHLILVADAVDRRKKLYKVIAELGAVLHFPKVKTGQRQKERLMEQVRGLLGEKGKRMTAAAWEILGEKTGFELRESVQAIEKLVTFVGDKTTIDAEDVEAVVGKSKEETVFQLISAMTERNLTASLGVLHELILQGAPWLMILAMISREIRHLLQSKLLIRSGAIKDFRPDLDYGEFQRKIYPALKNLAVQGGKKDMGLVSQHPYAAYQALRSARRFTEEELIGYLDQLVQIDLLLKSTGRDERLLIERFLIAVCTPREERVS
ncbi:MAG: DNA polymerase III subunit delta [Syntrophaceae bacterium]|nr:DNA polymerase III subunit delta [Syntrophaceae bacterium]